MKVGYARVSTDRQTLYQYIDALKASGCDEDNIFTDWATSAATKNRPGLQEARAALGAGDTFVVLSIDRAFRSTLEGLLFLDSLHQEGITFQSIYQCVDTGTPEGRKWFTYSVADAEYERAVISRRTKDKMAAAKRRGQHLGRPYSLTMSKTLAAHDLVKSGLPISRTAARFAVCHQTLTNSFKRLGLQF